MTDTSPTSMPSTLGSGLLTKRDEILWAAAEEISESGYSAASLANIAQRLGLTKGALTYHFPTKNGIGSALIDECVRVLHTTDTLTRRIYPEPSLPAVIAFQLLLGVEISQRPHVVAALEVFTDVNAPQSHVRELLDAWHGLLNDYIVHAQELGEVAPHLSVQDAGEFLVLMSLGQYHYYSRAKVPEGHARLRHYRLALAGLGAPDADAIVDGAIAALGQLMAQVPHSGTLGPMSEARGSRQA